nr:hypothetical transcript [Hymenolepis microstoma]
MTEAIAGSWLSPVCVPRELITERGPQFISVVSKIQSSPWFNEHSNHKLLVSRKWTRIIKHNLVIPRILTTELVIATIHRLPGEMHFYSTV